MGNWVKKIESTPVITAGAYAANDVVGGLIKLDLDGVPDGASGYLHSIVVSDKNNIKTALKVHFFTSAPASIADNAAFAPTYAEIKKRFAVIAVGAADFTSISTYAQAIKDGLRNSFVTDSATADSLWVYVTCDGTPTFSATDGLTFTFYFYAE